MHLEPLEWEKNRVWLYSVNTGLKRTVYGGSYPASGGGIAVDVWQPCYYSRCRIDFNVLVR